ncbi:MAG TPA: DUF2945 domain-containing protein [Candidatus Thermoplasmatota archaeon]|nr:DUF2945 domain-containing protein [Candidatus Thermoplasmatota archaeon]
MSERRYRVGDRVRWDHSQGTTEGKVVRVATEDGRIQDFEYTASEEDPRYIVESDRTGSRAAHREDELREG